MSKAGIDILCFWEVEKKSKSHCDLDFRFAEVVLVWIRKVQIVAISAVTSQTVKNRN